MLARQHACALCALQLPFDRAGSCDPRAIHARARRVVLRDSQTDEARRHSCLRLQNGGAANLLAGVSKTASLTRRQRCPLLPICPPGHVSWPGFFRCAGSAAPAQKRANTIWHNAFLHFAGATASAAALRAHGYGSPPFPLLENHSGLPLQRARERPKWRAGRPACAFPILFISPPGPWRAA